jgi:hypothetical protein
MLRSGRVVQNNFSKHLTSQWYADRIVSEGHSPAILQLRSVGFAARFLILGSERPSYPHKPLKILIDNPSSGGSTHTGLNRAMRLIKSRRAAPGRYHAETGVLLSIRILAHAVDQAEMRRQQEQRLRLFAVKRQKDNYDAIDRHMTEKECASVPLCGDLSKTQHCPTSSIVGWTYRTAVNRRISRMDSPEKVAAARAEYA